MTDTTAPTTTDLPTPTPTTPVEPSPSAVTPAPADPAAPVNPVAPADPAAPINPATSADPNAEPDPAQLRAVVPENVDGYTVNLSDEAKASLGMSDNDPLVAGLAKYAHENGKPQGWVDDALEAASALSAAGLFDGGFDPAAETAKLGENGAARQRDIEVYAEALKARGDIDDEMFGDLMSLAPTAGGVRLVEYFRKQGNSNAIAPIQPSGEAAQDKNEALEKAKELRRDPRYDNDRIFRAKADRAFKDAASQ